MRYASASGSFFTDVDGGERWLDAGVSDALLGHAHRGVADAVAHSLDNGVGPRDVAARLLQRFPPEFSVCTLTSSHSEACELALRLTRAHRPGKDVIVLEDADYGMTTSLVNMSPAHFRAKGSGQKFWVHVAGRRNPEDVTAKAWAIEASGRGVCGFFAEGIQPDGYLREAFASVRAAGGLNVAVEAHTGLGRIGEAMWEFARQGALLESGPDIVVVGESLANGLPLAAVVTTHELAAPFDVDGPTHPSICAAAQVVLEGLDAARVDLDLRQLQGRGAGLCWEIDVADAAAVMARLRERRVLLRARGNTLLVRPPLTFSAEEASQLLEGLKACV